MRPCGFDSHSGDFKLKNMESTVFVIFFILLVGIFASSYITINIQLTQFRNRLYVGVKLYNTYYMLNNEFDPGHYFEITVEKIGENQVQVRFDDGSRTIFDIAELYNSNWKFKYEL